MSFDVLLVDSDSTSRNVLKQAALAISNFRKANIAGTLSEALEKLNGSENCDVIFVSCQLVESGLDEFLKSAKATSKGSDCAMVVVVKGNAADGNNIATLLMNGVDAALCEPFSVDRLQEISEIAAKVKRRNADARKKAAVHLLMSNIVKEYDKIVSFMSRGLNVEAAKKRFADNCASLKRFQNESFEVYIDIAVQLFSEVKPQVLAQVSGSKRVREKLEAKLKEQYEKEYGGQAPS